ncbi:protein dispatched [Lutzomyia longipalpis]|uniref:protein dispatched n=1 Tax=Lutzomyia longipalpis TaxID=7200 RepID=UPI0024839A15|nr:protein dispatched [Lutzomyia longipalpis]XP_055677194.1 protein dispatched [Lutzomyia longipalpis]
MIWYNKLLAKKPHLILVAVAVFCVACIVVALTTRRFPDFSDPTLGFEARGTTISQRLTAWRNLLDETRPSGRLVANPLDDFQSVEIPGSRRRKIKGPREQKKRKKKKIPLPEKIKIIKNLPANGTYDLPEDYDSPDNLTLNSRHEHWDYGRNISYVSDESTKKRNKLKKDNWIKLTKMYPPPLTTDVHTTSDGFFCESPNKEYSHFVMRRINHQLNESLLERNALLAMCDLEQRIVGTNFYNDLCQRELTSQHCCRPWSIPNYVALLTNRSTCFDIEDEDVAIVRELLLQCFPYYHSLKLSNDCVHLKCNVPAECTQFNAVYNILHYLADVDFLTINDSNVFLTTAMVFIPIARSTKSLPFFHHLMAEPLRNELIDVPAMDMGLKNALFDECLLSDGWLIGLGGIFIVVCMWMYTTSLFVTTMTIVAIAFSLGVSYFIYTLIFELSFFPFMNLLAVVVIVGIGADDAFIFIKVWRCCIVERMKSSGYNFNSTSSFSSNFSHSDTLTDLMGMTLKHAALSMLVTSITTSAAFYASFVSSITAVRCFGIFAGTAVLVNYILMVTWLPAAVSIAERLSCFPSPCGLCKTLCTYVQNLMKRLRLAAEKIEDFIILLVLRYSSIWIVLLGLIGIGSGVIVLYWPKLRLPDSPDFKLFVSSHPFEVYDSHFKEMFWFEKIYTSSESFKLPLRFVWGVEPVDKGDYLNPAARGPLYLNPTFNVSLPESQTWLLDFCRKLRNQTFYQNSTGLLVPNCFIENFYTFMMRRCLDAMAEIDRTPCCENTTRPYDAYIFDQCLPQSISSLYETPREFFIPGVAGPKFARKDKASNVSLVRALVVEFDSTQPFTMSYSEISRFVRDVEDWLKGELEAAPPGMRDGWFISELDFYDLQDTLSQGTLLAIFMAMGVALLVLLLVTLNILISFYAIVTVTLTIFTTVATLVLLGWKLNVLESVAVTTAIGLAVDFSLHYGVHYRLCPDPDRESSVRFALMRMIGPTSMAAVTTGIAGALMLPSHLLAYIQIGIFLLVVMTISWFYATFFLTSLLRVVGPQYGFGQFRYPSLRIRDTAKSGKNGQNHEGTGSRDAGQRAVSEQLLSASSSAAGDFAGSESHELDSLTSNSIIKPPTTLEYSRPINFDRAFKKKFSYPREQSPSTASAITVVLPDDIAQDAKQF